ncbi:hypothetical protein [Actinomadura parmotrematis]|uniref:Thioredoxin family protein n=1 Tax=Actinomadura parmotrematis TaxID=2864039 RepID=A0ABS7FP95_9ACTN|nr:hypothetical protein [Actinomadura parmotrematis]MBW8482181.1 hypothetical protein [Actinomadura parmotrematis]
MSFQTSALLLSWVAIALLALVVAGLVRQVHALTDGAPRRTALGPEPGAAAPGFDRLGPGLLLFLDRDCGVCGEVLDAADGLGRPLHAVFSGPAADGLAPEITVLAGEGEGLFTDYRVPATPFAVLVDGHGRVTASEPVGSAEALRELLNLEGAR